MGYDFHITRAEYWADNAGAPITAEEWLAVVRADPELELSPETGMGPYFARWHGPSPQAAAWLDWAAGNVYTKNPDAALLRKLVRIAAQLGARVQGAEGEEYTGDELLDTELPPAGSEASSGQEPT